MRRAELQRRAVSGDRSCGQGLGESTALNALEEAFPDFSVRRAEPEILHIRRWNG